MSIFCELLLNNNNLIVIMTESNFKPGFTALASGFFSWLADFILYPIDTISTRLKGSRAKVGPVRFLIHSMKTQARSLYRGVTLTVPHSLVPTGVYIYLYQNLMHYASSFVDKVTSHKQVKLVFPFFMSMLAEGVALVIQLPFDTVRTRIQMNLPEYQYSSAFQGLKQIYQREGLLRFYKSTRIYFATKTLYTGLQFQFYELFNYRYGHHPYAVFANAVLSAVFATAILNPLEVVITRYALVDTTKKKLVFSSLVKRLWQREGIAGFYKGVLTETLIKSVYSLMWMPVFQYMRDVYGVNLAD